MDNNNNHINRKNNDRRRSFLKSRRAEKSGNIQRHEIECYRKFNQVECKKFKLNEKEKDPKCYCGEIEVNHIDGYEVLKEDQEWKLEDAVIKYETKTYGKIQFNTTSDTSSTSFVRLNNCDDLNNVFDLLFNHWKIKKGTLCLSIIGGAKNFSLRKWEKDIFINGLIKAAHTTEALIITSGLNLGIAKLVGEAIHEGKNYMFDKSKRNEPLCCLGVSPWGYVRNRSDLADKKNKEKLFYTVSDDIPSKQPVSLNPHHTHYLFVDEGLRNTFRGTKAGEFRANLENKLHTDHNLPVVLLIVEGGEDVFVEASRSIKEKVPLVICAGTGRAADILVNAFQNKHKLKIGSEMSNIYREKLKTSIMNKIFPSERDSNSGKISEERKAKDQVELTKKTDQCILNIEIIVEDENLITIFDMKTNEDLDAAIMISLLKKIYHSKDGKNDSQTSDNLFKALKLCLKWNRADIARDKIFNKNVVISEKNWTDLLLKALKKGKTELVEIFLNNGAPLTLILNRQNLVHLYRFSYGRRHFEHTYHHYSNKYFDDTKELFNVQELIDYLFNDRNIISKKTETSSYSYVDLMMWAILMEYHEIANIFWERCDNSIFSGLVATRLYRAIDKAIKRFKDTEREATLKLWKNHFENLSIQVLEQCNDIDHKLARRLIEKPHDRWPHLNCLELAYKSSDQRFISSSVVQSSIDESWLSERSVTLLQCIVSVFLPCWCLKTQKSSQQYSQQILVSVEDDEDIQNNTTPCPDNKPTIHVNNTGDSSCHGSVDYQNRCNCCSVSLKDIHKFYTAPQTKFMIHLMVTFTCLFYFSTVVLFLMEQDRSTVHEIIYYAYLCGFVLVKFIEMATFNKKNVRLSGMDWWKFSHWNKLDVVIIVFSFCAVLLGRIRFYFTQLQLNYMYRSAKTFYSFIVGLMYLQCLRFLTLNPRIGPKMVMISRMIEELVLYLYILVLILLSYGVTSQSTYYPQRNFSINYMWDVVQDPYWALFGELRLDTTVYLQNQCNDTQLLYDRFCAQYNPIIPIIFAVYIFIGIILLLNVLIAIFSFIFQEIHGNSVDIWKYSMYGLVTEYKRKKILPAPFSLFIYIIILFKICKKKSKVEATDVSSIDAKSLNNSTDSHRLSNVLKPYSSDIESTIESNSNTDTSHLEENYLEKNCHRIVIKKRKDKQRTILGNFMLSLEKELKSLTNKLSYIETKMDNSQLTIQSIFEEGAHSGTSTLNISYEKPSNESIDHSSYLSEFQQLKLDIQSNLKNLTNQHVNVNTTLEQIQQNIHNQLKKLHKKYKMSLGSTRTQPIEATSSFVETNDPIDERTTLSNTNRSTDNNSLLLDQINKRFKTQEMSIAKLEDKLEQFQQKMLSSFTTLEYILQDSRI